MSETETRSERYEHIKRVACEDYIQEQIRKQLMDTGTVVDCEVKLNGRKCDIWLPCPRRAVEVKSYGGDVIRAFGQAVCYRQDERVEESYIAIPHDNYERILEMCEDINIGLVKVDAETGEIIGVEHPKQAND